MHLRIDVLLALCGLVALGAAMPQHLLHHASVLHTAPLYHHAKVEPVAYPKYHFNYGVKDGHTGDIKEQEEERDGDVVKGSYSLVESDGTVRKVEYHDDGHSGFNAVVTRSGHAHHPATHVVHKIPAVVPVAHEGFHGGLALSTYH